MRPAYSRSLTTVPLRRSSPLEGAVRFEDAEALGPWRVAQHAHWHAPWAGETVALSALPSGSSLPS
jgi:hypothetical protein